MGNLLVETAPEPQYKPSTNSTTTYSQKTYHNFETNPKPTQQGVINGESIGYQHKHNDYASTYAKVTPSQYGNSSATVGVSLTF